MEIGQTALTIIHSGVAKNNNQPKRGVEYATRNTQFKHVQNSTESGEWWKFLNSRFWESCWAAICRIQLETKKKSIQSFTYIICIQYLYFVCVHLSSYLSCHHRTVTKCPYVYRRLTLPCIKSRLQGNYNWILHKILHINYIITNFKHIKVIAPSL